MSWLEKKVPLGRKGRGGSQKQFVKLAYAAFLDRDSRNLDPQVHMHVVPPNIGLLKDGTWCSLNSTLLHRYMQTLDALVCTEFFAEVHRTLGLQAELPFDENGQPKCHAELSGIPKPLVDHWSSRSRDKDAALAGQSNDPTLAKNASAKAKQKATIATRRPKITAAPLNKRQEAWRIEAGTFGLTPDRVALLLGQRRTPNFERIYRRVRHQVIRAFEIQDAHFGKRDFIRKVCQAMQHTGVSLAWLLPRIDKDLKHAQDLVPLKWHSGQPRFTTVKTWNLEKDLLATATKLRKRKHIAVSHAIIEKVLRKYSKLTPQQADAVRQILSGRSSLSIVTGVAGAGKSYVFDAVRYGLQRAGYQVIGGALSGVAAEELREKAKIPSRTLASYLWHTDPDKADKFRRTLSHEWKQLMRALLGKSRQNPRPFQFCRKHVLVIDEIGMVGTRTLNRIFKLSDKYGFALIPVGDNAQLQPIEAGAPLNHLVKQFGSVHLSENFRQKDAADKRAVAALREGKAADALANYAERGRLHIGVDRSATYGLLTEDWRSNGGAKEPTKHVIFVDTRADERAINDRCQKIRQDLGLVQRSLGVSVGNERFHVGDRVLFKTGLHEFGIRNGYQGKVVATNPLLRTISVWLDKAPTAHDGKPAGRRLVTIPISQLGKDGLRRSYAITAHGGQGMTADRNVSMTLRH